MSSGDGRWILSSDDERKIERFRKYAEELRVLSDKIVSPAAKALILRVVADYERMADRLEVLPGNNPQVHAARLSAPNSSNL